MTSATLLLMCVCVCLMCVCVCAFDTMALADFQEASDAPCNLCGAVHFLQVTRISFALYLFPDASRWEICSLISVLGSIKQTLFFVFYFKLSLWFISPTVTHRPKTCNFHYSPCPEGGCALNFMGPASKPCSGFIYLLYYLLIPFFIRPFCRCIGESALIGFGSFFLSCT